MSYYLKYSIKNLMNDLTEINSTDPVIKTVNKSICYLDINRPDKLNALSEEVLTLLIRHLIERL